MYVYLIKQIKLGKEELNMIRFKEACGNAGKVLKDHRGAKPRD